MLNSVKEILQVIFIKESKNQTKENPNLDIKNETVQKNISQLNPNNKSHTKNLINIKNNALYSYKNIFKNN